MLALKLFNACCPGNCVPCILGCLTQRPKTTTSQSKPEPLQHSFSWSVGTVALCPSQSCVPCISHTSATRCACPDLVVHTPSYCICLFWLSDHRPMVWETETPVLCLHTCRVARRLCTSVTSPLHLRQMLLPMSQGRRLKACSASHCLSLGSLVLRSLDQIVYLQCMACVVEF